MQFLEHFKSVFSETWQIVGSHPFSGTAGVSFPPPNSLSQRTMKRKLAKKINNKQTMFMKLGNSDSKAESQRSGANSEPTY